MRLQAWDFEVVEQAAEDGAMLDIKPDPRTWWARVRVGSFFQHDGDIHNDPEEQRKAVVHELLHLPQADLLFWLEQGTWKLPLAPDTAQHIEEKVLAEIEKQTEFAARLIAPNMPLPPEWVDG